MEHDTFELLDAAVKAINELNTTIEVQYLAGGDEGISKKYMDALLEKYPEIKKKTEVKENEPRN